MNRHPPNDNMTPTLLSLPEEIIFKILLPLERRELRALRLVCHRLHPAATRALFSLVRMYPSDESIARYTKIASHPSFKTYIRHLDINTLEDEDDEEDDHAEPLTLSPAFTAALLTLPTLPTLTSLTLHFSPKGCRDWTYPTERHRWNTEYAQDTSYRSSLLTTLLPALSRCPHLTTLHLDNLLNTTTDSPSSPSPLLLLPPTLTALHLHIITESEEACPENEIFDPRLHAFMTELRTTVLTSDLAANLQSLALYQTTFHFGFSPKLDLRGVHLPRLRSLALGNYVFTHDWQLEWLGAHAGTLEELFLDDCVVVYYAKMSECGVDAEGYPVFDAGDGRAGTQRGDLGLGKFRFYEMTWAKILGYIEREMVGDGRPLGRVMVGSSTRWDRGMPRREEEEDQGRQRRYAGREWQDLAVGMFKGSYCMFDMGIGPYQYTDGGRPKAHYEMDEFDGGGTEDARKCVDFLLRIGEQEDEDVVALRSLLAKLGQKVEETWEDDVMKVEGLKGRRHWG